MLIPQFLIATLEAACNRYLALDDEALPKFAAFEGKIIAVEIIGLEQTLFLFPAADGILILSEFDGEADTTISGTPMALTRLGLADDASSLLFAGEIRITGDTRLGHQFKKVLQQFNIDWEEQLSRYIGDMAAHQIGNAARDFSTWLRRSTRSLHMDMGEYLQEESRLVVGKAEIDRFIRDVDLLRDAVERIDARLARLI